MNPDLLERLAIDEALGQLSPDAETLLREVLAVEPEASRLAAEFRETVELASNALKGRARPPELLPPYDPAPFRRRHSRQWLAVAASFVVGAGMTGAVFRGFAPGHENPPPRVLASAPQSSAMAPTPEIERAARSLPFWSAQRAYLLASSSKATKTPR